MTTATTPTARWLYRTVPAVASPSPYTAPGVDTASASLLTKSTWRTERRASACAKANVAIVVVVVVVAAVLVFLWLAGDLGASSPLDPDGTGPQPEPPPPSPSFNHSLGPLVRTLSFVETLPSTPSYAVIAGGGLYVYTLHSGTKSIAAWQQDSLFYELVLLNATAATIPFSGPYLGYASQGDTSSLLVGHPSINGLTLYSINPDDGSLTIGNSCTPEPIQLIASLTDDTAGLQIAGTDGTYIFTIYIDPTTNALVCSGAGTSYQSYSALSVPPFLSVIVDPSNSWLYSIHQSGVYAWDWPALATHTPVLSGPSRNLIGHVAMVGDDPLASSLCVLDTLMGELQLYTVNVADNGTLSLSDFVQVVDGSYSFAITPLFAYVLSGEFIQEFQYPLALNPPTVDLPITNSALMILVFPGFDAVNLYSLTTPQLFQYVIE